MFLQNRSKYTALIPLLMYLSFLYKNAESVQPTIADIKLVGQLQYMGQLYKYSTFKHLWDILKIHSKCVVIFKTERPDA